MAKSKSYSEAELIDTFQLNRQVGILPDTLKNWIAVEPPVLDLVEQAIFDRIFAAAVKNMWGWNEEDLKMKFIANVLPLGHIMDGDKFLTFFEKTISAVVDGHPLTTKTDFMVATGILDMPKKPFFHFQEYKPHRKPSGDSMAQLLEAMLIAQAINNNGKPIYGCEILGRQWYFVVLEGRTYSVSNSYECTEKNDLLAIISILRKFRYILETELLD